MTNPWDSHIAYAAKVVAEEFAGRVDPDEMTYTSIASLQEVRREIEVLLDAAIADWLLEKTRESEGRTA